MGYRHLIVTLIPTKKPHKVESFGRCTNEKDDLDNLLSEIRTRLESDDVMQINILRDCHSNSSKGSETQ